MCSVTSQGSAYMRFRRALDRGNALEARATGAELGELPLSDALELLLLIARKEPDRYGRAALRWHARYVRQIRDVTPGEAQAILALLLLLNGQRGRAAAKALAMLLEGPSARQAPTLLLRWADEQTSPSAVR